MGLMNDLKNLVKDGLEGAALGTALAVLMWAVIFAAAFLFIVS